MYNGAKPAGVSGVVFVRLYLVQHGEAKSEAEDPDRPLTDRGADQVRQVATLAGAAGLVMVERVVHSGKTRARQTAETWGGGVGVPIEKSRGARPRRRPARGGRPAGGWGGRHAGRPPAPPGQTRR